MLRASQSRMFKEFASRPAPSATPITLNTNNPKYEEQRGKAAKISPKDVRRMEQILEEDGFCARALIWEQLGYEADLDVCRATIPRHMGTIDYHKCLACRKGWANEATKKKRLEYAEYWIQPYPEPED